MLSSFQGNITKECVMYNEGEFAALAQRFAAKIVSDEDCNAELFLLETKPKIIRRNVVHASKAFVWFEK